MYYSRMFPSKAERILHISILYISNLYISAHMCLCLSISVYSQVFFTFPPLIRVLLVCTYYCVALRSSLEVSYDSSLHRNKHQVHMDIICIRESQCRYKIYAWIKKKNVIEPVVRLPIGNLKKLYFHVHSLWKGGRGP